MFHIISFSPLMQLSLPHKSSRPSGRTIKNNQGPRSLIVNPNMFTLNNVGCTRLWIKQHVKKQTCQWMAWLLLKLNTMLQIIQLIHLWWWSKSIKISLHCFNYMWSVQYEEKHTLRVITKSSARCKLKTQLQFIEMPQTYLGRTAARTHVPWSSIV